MVSYRTFRCRSSTMLQFRLRSIQRPITVIAGEELPILSSPMLLGPPSEVFHCRARAEECARKADEAFTEEMREEFLRLRQSWLNLARSYEFAERLLGFSKDNKRRRAEIYGIGDRDPLSE